MPSRRTPHDGIAPRRNHARRLRFRLPFAVAALAALPACYDQPLVPSQETDGRLTVTNDEATLALRVGYTETGVPIEPEAAPAPAPGPSGVSPARAPSSISLTLIADVVAPTVDGEALQATSVWVTRDDRAVVGYAMRGAPALGALDWFMSLRSKKPKLRSSVTFTDADVTAAFTDGLVAFAAQASSDPALLAPAVLERIGVQGDRFHLEESARVALSSFAATSAVSVGSVVYATSGDGGGVFALAASDLSLLGQYPLDDARWVAYDDLGDRIVVLQGTPGRLAVFEEGVFPGGSMSLLNTYSVPGVDVAESKSTVEVAGRKAFVGAGPSGVQVVCLDDGQIVGSVARPDPALLGLDPSVVVTNSVTVDGDLMFIGNGEAGVYAAAGATSFASSSCSSQQTITVLGQLQFGALESVNHVSYRDGFLFVAAGLGGIKVVDVSTN